MGKREGREVHSAEHLGASAADRKQVRRRCHPHSATRRQRAALGEESHHGNTHLRTGHRPAERSVAPVGSVVASVAREGRTRSSDQRQFRAIRYSRGGGGNRGGWITSRARETDQ